MKKRYFIKKNPHCSHDQIEWIELSGQEYYRFINNPANKGRHFADMGNVVLECTYEQAKSNKADNDRQDYINELGENISFVSIYAYESEDQMNGEDVIADAMQDVEETAIHNIRLITLRKALQLLPAEDQFIVKQRYCNESRMSEAEIGALVGLSQSGLSKRLKKIRRNLKILVIKLEKIPQ